MKFLLILLSLNPLSEVRYSHFFNDELCYLEESEMQQLEGIAVELKAATEIDIVYVCHEYNMMDGSSPKGRLVIYLDEDPERRSIRSMQRTLLLKQDYLERLTIQYLQQGDRGDELVKMISFLSREIENRWLAERQFETQSVDEDEEEMSPEFWVVVKIYGILILIYGIWVFLKWRNQATNKAEYWEHYGYSRFPVWLRYSLWVVVFSVYFLALYSFVYYYTEIFILLIPLAFLMRPSVMLVSSLISIGLDWKKNIPVDGGQQARISFGQKRFLFSPKSTTEDLILLDLLELVIKGHIAITPQPKEERYGPGAYYKFLSVNEEVDHEALSSFQQELVHQLKKGKNFTVLDKVMATIIYETGSFKAIRKDYFMKDLVRSNFMSQKSWAMNRFDLSPEGNAYQKNLSSLVKKMDDLLREVLAGQASVDQLKEEVLLVHGYERKMEGLYNYIVEKGQYEECQKMVLAPILDQTFSFHEFRYAIERQINKIHQSYKVDESNQMGEYV